jgi:hypothetical protein
MRAWRRLTGRKRRNSIEGELGVLNAETCYVADDASLPMVLDSTRSLR